MACMWDRRDAYRVLVGEPERRRLLGRSRLMWDNNIKTDRQKIGCKGVDWIDLTQDRGK